VTVVEAGPVLSAHREEDEPWRIERLRELLPKIAGLPILALCDRKGCQLYEYNSDHFVEGRLLIGDECNDPP
jgi:hypothetical protein